MGSQISRFSLTKQATRTECSGSGKTDILACFSDLTDLKIIDI